MRRTWRGVKFIASFSAQDRKAFTLYVAVSFLPHTFQGLWKELKIA